jgi:deoxyribose-phosphate aldolase
MTYIEYATYDLDNSIEELKKDLDIVTSLNIDCISVPYSAIKYCKNLIKNSKQNIIVSTAIDYPLGIMDLDSRLCCVQNAIDVGVNKIDIVIQNNYLNTKKYDKLKIDIDNIKNICIKNNIELFYYLEYRIFTHQSLIKACQLLMQNSLKNIYVSTGHMIDSIEDNIIACVLLKDKTGINTIFSGNIWTKAHVKLLNKYNIDMLRFKNVNSILTYIENADHVR